LTPIARWRFGEPPLPLILLAPQKDEDAGEQSDDSSYKPEVKTKNSNQTNENQIDRQQKHSNIFCEGHEAMICIPRLMSRQIMRTNN
jgi:hypothetical protein